MSRRYFAAMGHLPPVKNRLTAVTSLERHLSRSKERNQNTGKTTQDGKTLLNSDHDEQTEDRGGYAKRRADPTRKASACYARGDACDDGNSKLRGPRRQMAAPCASTRRTAGQASRQLVSEQIGRASLDARLRCSWGAAQFQTIRTARIAPAAQWPQYDVSTPTRAGVHRRTLGCKQARSHYGRTRRRREIGHRPASLECICLIADRLYAGDPQAMRLLSRAARPVLTVCSRRLAGRQLLVRLIMLHIARVETSGTMSTWSQRACSRNDSDRYRVSGQHGPSRSRSAACTRATVATLSRDVDEAIRGPAWGLRGEASSSTPERGVMTERRSLRVRARQSQAGNQ